MLTFLLFLISPLMSLPVCIYKICIQRYNYLYLLGAFFALWSMCIPPIADQSRYFMYIYNGNPLQVNSINDIVYFNLIRIACNLFHQINLKLEVLRAITVYCSWCAVTSIFIDVSKNAEKKLTSSNCFALLMLLLGAFPLIAISFGLRWGMACCFATAAIYWCVEKKRKLLSIFLLIISCATHIAIIAYIVPAMLLYKNTPIHKKNVFIWSIIIIIIGSEYFIPYCLSFLPSDFYFYKHYLAKDAYWNGENINDLTVLGQIFIFVRQAPVYLYLLFILIKWENNTPFTKMLLALFLIGFATMSLSSVYMRLNIILILFCAFDLATKYLKNKVSSIQLVLFTLLFFGLSILFHIQFRNLRDYSVEGEFFISSVLYPITHHYDYDYFYSKITPDGNYFIDKQ